MVYDREMGSMRVLLVSPMPRSWLLSCKLVAGMLVACLQVYVFLAIAWLWEVEPPAYGYLTVFPALLLTGLMLGALGLLLSSLIRQLENFAGVMNFVIFPMFFASSALYPLWRMRESSLLLWQISAANPFSHARRADPLRPLRPARADLAPAHADVDRHFPGRRPLRLQSRARLRGGDRQGRMSAPPQRVSGQMRSVL